MENQNYILITGATGVLGKEFCRKLAVDGFNLFLTGRSDEKLIVLEKELLSLNCKISVKHFACDLTDFSDRNALFNAILSDNIKLEKLINVAGVDTQKAFDKYTQEKLVFQSRILFEATVSVTKFALENKSNQLDILTISSICGTIPMPYFAIYSALKGALTTFFDALRVEFRNDKNIVITTILPGSIPTRPDIIKDIKKQGLTGKLSAKPPKFIVEKSLWALKKHKKNYIPGAYNRLVHFFEKITPKSLKMKVIEKKFKHKEKDAF